MNGGVTISPNLKREKVRIDINGNRIDPQTMQVVELAEQNYRVNPEDLAVMSAKKPPTEEELKQAREEIKAGKIIVPGANKPGRPKKVKEEPQEESTGGLSDAINKIIEKKISEAVTKAIEGIDIEAIVNKALK